MPAWFGVIDLSDLFAIDNPDFDIVHAELVKRFRATSYNATDIVFRGLVDDLASAGTFTQLNKDLNYIRAWADQNHVRVWIKTYADS